MLLLSLTVKKVLLIAKVALILKLMNLLKIFFKHVPRDKPGNNTCSNAITVEELERRIRRLKDLQHVPEKADMVEKTYIDEERS